MKMSKVSHLFSLLQNSPIQLVEEKGFSAQGIRLDIKRDDLIHPIISGNKWRKLKYLLLSIESQGYRSVASMGGAYSNFLHVLAYICSQLGWSCELYVRAYENQPLTPTLKDCLKWGARVRFTDREKFRQLRNESPEIDGDTFWITEGGVADKAILGLSEIFMELDQLYDYICMASATGTSIAGLIQGAKIYQSKSKIIGVSVLNNVEEQRENVVNLIGKTETDWSIIDGYEFSGFAKKNEQLTSFVNDFSLKHNIPLEPVYSGKSFFAMMDLIKMEYFEANAKILLIHCGGLQGRRRISVRD